MEIQRHKDLGTLSPAAAGPKPIPDATEKVASGIVDAAFRVHSTLGPGLLESVYEDEACMSHELRNRGISFNTQVSFPSFMMDSASIRGSSRPTGSESRSC
jgi:hypothetical protein